MTEIKFLQGFVDCHFDQNARIAIKNFLAGRPLFEGQLPPTFIPAEGHAPVIIGIDTGSDDKTAAHYQCRRCQHLRTFTERPATLPLHFQCQCGQEIILDDPILRDLPE